MTATVNRQRFSLNLGLGIMAFYAIFAGLMWFVISIPGERVAIREIATPVTIGYAVAVLKYFLDTNGIVTSKEVIGTRLVVLVVGIVAVFGLSLIGAPFVYLNTPTMPPELLNGFFVAVESAFGALLALIFSYLYKMP